MLKDYNNSLKEAKIPVRKRLKKLGTVKFNTVETTPVVWKDKLIRFEWVRPNTREIPDGIWRDVGCYHFVDMETEKQICKKIQENDELLEIEVNRTVGVF